MDEELKQVGVGVDSHGKSYKVFEAEGFKFFLYEGPESHQWHYFPRPLDHFPGWIWKEGEPGPRRMTYLERLCAALKNLFGSF